MPTQVRPDDIVRVINREDFPVKVQYNSREYVLQPGRETFIPGACAFTWFGDPRAAAGFQSIPDEDGTRIFIVDRATEVRRVRIKWGAGMGGDESNFEGVAVPRVELWTAEGEKLTTLLDDPEGRNVNPAETSARSDDQLRDLVASQQRQIELMKEHLGLKDEDEQSAVDEGELPADGDLPAGLVS